MKSIRNYTIRGQLQPNTVKKILLFDGRFDTGFKLLKFVIAPQNVRNQEEVQCKLMTESKPHSVTWDWDVNSEIGWATWNTPEPQRSGQFSLVDHEAIVVEDLYIDSTADDGEVVNYYIEMEKVSITDWTGALAMVRNSNQSV